MEELRHWHVLVTVTGAAVQPMMLRSALLRFAEQRPFLETLTFTATGAEFAYWDEGTSMAEVSRLAVGVWEEHRESAGLPDWEVVGLQVLERPAFHQSPGHDAVLIGAQEIRLPF